MTIDFDLDSRLGAYPSPWDDRHYRVPLATMKAVEETPDVFNLLEWVKRPLNDQGNVGSCVGHDGDMVLSALYYRDDLVYDDFSAGWLYWCSRFWANIIDPAIEGSTNLGLMKALHKEGATTEVCAPTDTVKPFEIDPCAEAYDIAKNYMIESYHYVNKAPTDIKAAMYGLIDGFPEKTPLVSAYPVYESFRDGYDDGVVPMPQPGETLRGGHSSALFGWEKIGGEDYWINVNSWGEDIGDNGLFYLPIDYPFYDVWLMKIGTPKPPEPQKSLVCQLLEALSGYFDCKGGEA